MMLHVTGLCNVFINIICLNLEDCKNNKSTKNNITFTQKIKIVDAI